MAGQTRRHLIHQGGGHARLVTLEVDDQGLVGPATQGDDLGQAVGAAAMIGAGHDHLGAKGLAGGGDTLVVRGDQDLRRRRGLGALINMPDQGLTRDLQQGLTRQARSRVARRDDDLEGQAGHRQRIYPPSSQAPFRPRSRLTPPHSSLGHLFIGGQFPRLLLQHDRDIVTDGEGQTIGAADQLRRGLIKMREAPCREGTDQDIQEFLIHSSDL